MNGLIMTWKTIYCCSGCLALLLLYVPAIEAIGCFVCTSENHQNPECEDTFNNTGKFYVEDCWASRRGRTGTFPGTQCIKMIAEDSSMNYTVVVRNCVVDDGGTNSETEIGRESHCGWMRVLKYNGRRMRGCILSCETDACNHGNRPQKALTSKLTLFASWAALLVAGFLCRSSAG